jgi:hypothetical protein
MAIGSANDNRFIHEATLLWCLVHDSLASISMMISCPLAFCILIAVARSDSRRDLGSLCVIPWSNAIMYCCRNAVVTPAVANLWSHTLYTENTDTFVSDRPAMVIDDHRPMARGSESVVEREAHFSVAIVSVPPGWNVESFLTSDPEKENDVRKKCLRNMDITDDRLFFHSQSVFVSTSPRILMPSSIDLAAINWTLSFRPFTFCSSIRHAVGDPCKRSPNGLLL